MMRPTLALCFIALLPLSLTTAQDTTTDDFNNKLDNIEVKPSARLDPYIRKALLRALSELEESGDVITSADGNDVFSSSNSGIQDNEDFTESQTAKEGIQIHSFVVNGQAAFENSTSSIPTVLDSKISILSTTAGNVENQATYTRSTISPINDYYQTKSSGINLQQVRSIPTSTLQNINNDEKTTSFKQRLSTTTASTTTTTTTTTTPKPTHNEDGENIEDVDKRDVQVYQAPLVAAFTVHQDANGLPKKVIPLYQQTNGQQLLRPAPTNTVPTVFTPQPLRQTIPLPTLLPNGNISPVRQNEFIAHQLYLQKELEEKQRLLEEQLRLLQLQQSQQEELLRKQQYFLQNSNKQLQNNIFDQTRTRNIVSNSPVNNFSGQKNFQQSQIPTPNSLRSQNSFVSIQPSVPFEQTTIVPNQQQQLPNREAVDFLLQLRNHQFPLQENHLPQGIGSFLQPSQTQSFHQGLNFNQISTNQLVPKQNTRVFRQESGVGNLGINNQNYNRFNTFNPVYTNRYFPQQQPRPVQTQYTPDFELKQLLYQNGLNGRHNEDLNIVSKVLSLNHGIPLNNVSNRLPFDSRRQVNSFI